MVYRIVSSTGNYEPKNISQHPQQARKLRYNDNNNKYKNNNITPSKIGNGSLLAGILIAAAFFVITSNSGTTLVYADSGMSSAILYYGPMDSSAVGRIASVHPSIAIINSDTSGISSSGVSQLHSAGTKIIGYMSIGYNGVPLSDAISHAKSILGSGADGVFVDNSNPSGDSYLSQLYSAVKGSGGIVICNPGMVYLDESVMSTCDIVSFEHQWRSAGQISWLHNYPATRYLGLNSNGGSGVGDPSQNLADAHSMGISYQYSTTEFTTLPDWIGIYSSNGASATAESTLKDPTPPSDTTMQTATTSHATITVTTVDPSGSPINGYYTTLWQNGKQIESGYSPASFSVTSGNSYQVSVADYGSFRFDHWSDGTTSRLHDVAAGSSGSTTHLEAVYKHVG